MYSSCLRYGPEDLARTKLDPHARILRWGQFAKNECFKIKGTHSSSSDEWIDVLERHIRRGSGEVTHYFIRWWKPVRRIELYVSILDLRHTSRVPDEHSISTPYAQFRRTMLNWRLKHLPATPTSLRQWCDMIDADDCLGLAMEDNGPETVPFYRGCLNERVALFVSEKLKA